MIFDTHCDTLNAVLSSNSSLRKNNLRLDLTRTSQYDGYTQFFAVWLENSKNAVEKFNTISDLFNSELAKNSDIAKKCVSYNDLKKAQSESKTAAFLSLEGAYFINSPEDIDMIFKKGVRCVSLTWNNDSALAGGVNSNNGLTKLGRELIPVFEQKGILLDVSHLNEKSFWELAWLAKKPFIASHSCSKALCSSKRNLTDEQFSKICASGGCVGVNFYPTFLSNDSTAAIADIAEHIKHFKKIDGIDFVGFGSDFDGTDLLPDGISGAESMKQIVSALSYHGFSSDEIDKVTHLNFERVIKDVL